MCMVYLRDRLVFHELLLYLQVTSDLRPLSPLDIERVRVLCEECFPVHYPDSWYRYITSTKVPPTI